MISKVAIALALVFTACVHPGRCYRIKSLYCGTNGVTYGSQFFEEAVKLNPGLELDYYGRCEDDPATSDCPQEIETICSSYGVIYPNRCHFDLDASKDPTLTVADLTLCDRPPVKNFDFLVCISGARMVLYSHFKEMQKLDPSIQIIPQSICDKWIPIPDPITPPAVEI